ncbi:MAG: hypothetical protein U5N10_03510 [Gemmobacter sp.]|nr:hypothetical protein [Gemmobacter sp.]
MLFLVDARNLGRDRHILQLQLVFFVQHIGQFGGQPVAARHILIIGHGDLLFRADRTTLA